MELEESIFGVISNESVLHEAVVNHLANKRRGTHSTLTRGEVRGGGINPINKIKWIVRGRVPFGCRTGPHQRYL